MKWVSALVVVALSALLLAANGDQYGISFRGQQGIKLLDQQSASYTGTWVDVSNSKSASITIDQLESGGSLQIMESNGATQPSDSTDGPISYTQNGPLTAPGVCLLSGASLPARYIKIKKIAGGSPVATTALFWGLNR